MTLRERVMQLLAQGWTIPAIAKYLHKSEDLVAALVANN